MDKKYWTDYYTKKMAPTNPTQFAKDITSYLEINNVILDLGCGNGRDSVYFDELGLKVVAIDQAESAISELRKIYGDKIKFVLGDFIESTLIDELNYDYVYSRFTIHAVTDMQEDELLDKVYKILKPDGIFFIEARSIKDDLFGKGQMVEKNAYIYNQHYRRFIDIDNLIMKLKKRGFAIYDSTQGKNLAVYKDENPAVIRVIAKKVLK
jgi:ubiquinone/menaquinone biosynthesis C-methylase UbiE